MPDRFVAYRFGFGSMGRYGCFDDGMAFGCQHSYAAEGASVFIQGDNGLAESLIPDNSFPLFLAIVLAGVGGGLLVEIEKGEGVFIGFLVDDGLLGNRSLTWVGKEVF